MFANNAAIIAAALVTDLAESTEQHADSPTDAAAATAVILMAQGLPLGADNATLCDLARLAAESYNHDELCTAWRRVGWIERRIERDAQLVQTMMVLEVAIHMRERRPYGAW